MTGQYFPTTSQLCTRGKGGVLSFFGSCVEFRFGDSCAGKALRDENSVVQGICVHGATMPPTVVATRVGSVKVLLNLFRLPTKVGNFGHRFKKSAEQPRCSF